MKVADNAMEFRKLALQTSLIAGLAGLVVVTATLLIGKQLLMVIGGADFGQGGTILIALVMAASIDMARVPFEPVLHSTGRAHHELFARVLGLIGLGVGLWLLIDTGPSGAAWAVASASFLTYLAMAAAAFHAVQRPTQDV
jgi:Na+-driven multidrug efflux pump